MLNRRSLFTGAAAAALTPIWARPVRAATSPRKNPVVIFAKHVQEMDFAELGRRLKAISADGIEATLRKGGQIDPEHLSDRLGTLVDALAKSDQRVIIAASNVNAVNAASENYIAELAKSQVPYLRMAYYKYDLSKPMLPQLDAFAKQAADLSKLCAAHGVTALYQNHAGRAYVGAALWDLHQALKEVDSDGLKVAVDIRHTTLELTQSYEAGYKSIRPMQGATYVKDYDWVDGKPQNVPLGMGRAKPLFDIIQRDGFIGPLSLHMEYTDHRDPTKLEESWRAIAADMKTLRRWLGEGA